MKHVLHTHKSLTVTAFCFFVSLGSLFSQASSGDCLGAIPVCELNYSVQPLVVPPDNVPNEINGTISCLSNGEENGVWYTFTVQSTGLLHFNIIPYNHSDDYDWALFNLTNANCSDISTNVSLQAGCNFSANVSNNGITGANNGPNPQDEPEINVVQGETYVLYISNFSQSNGGYTLDFAGSSAQIPDNNPPTLQSATPNKPCGATKIRLQFSENISCNSVDPSDFTITGPGGPYTITGVSSTNCTAGSAYADWYDLIISPPLNSGGNYTVNVTGVISDVCSNNIANGTSVGFVYNAISLDSNVVDASCGVNDGQATVIPSGGTPPYSYQWSDPTSQTTQTATNLARGTYTVTVTDAQGCVSSLLVKVSDPTSFTFTIQQLPDTCSKGAGVVTVNVNGTTAPYQYNWNNEFTNNINTYTGAEGDSAFYIRITDNIGCWLDTTFTIDNILNDTLEAYYVVSDQQVDFLWPYATFSNQSLYYNSLLWNLPGGGTSNAEQFTFDFTSFALGDYPVSLIAYDANGCRDTFTLIMTLYTQFALYIPNAFTVNDDGLNDDFDIKGMGIDSSTFEMRIFDRLGQCIFYTEDLSDKWDGTVNGRNTNDSEGGVFVYRIFVRDIYGGPHNFTGKVLVIK